MESVFAFFENIDNGLLLFVNGLHTPFLDEVMWQISSRFIWIPLYVFLAALVIKKLGVKNGIIALLLVALLIVTTDQICASLIRPNVSRLRPSNELNPISGYLHFVNGYRGGSFGFPSCHAVNTLALTVYLSLLTRSRWLLLGLSVWTLATVYSRLYLGVHYPTDIMAGFMIGAFWAVFYYYAYKFLSRVDFIRIFRSIVPLKE